MIKQRTGVSQIDDRQIQLAQAAVTGDLESYGRLCEALYPAMVAIAYSVLADHHMAEDAAQESYAKALVKLPGLKKPASFSAWMARICRNCALDMARKNTRIRGVSDMSRLPVDEPQEENKYVPIIRHLINELPPSAKEMIMLRYYNKKSHQQMAAVLGMTRGAVRSKLQRIRVKLA
ncbi:MAG: sigma-70 family RNA polymerase sigma factor, partial [Phycisphaeraceae bacterium]|nr:sigma-70 family RNA polymerase sigma factor [Phycisphaeraceae bacterium]